MKTKLSMMLLASCISTQAWSQQTALKINEVMVANIDMILDPSFNYGGWIEIYNPGTTAVSMSNMYVSDDATNLKKFRLPTNIGSVPAGGFKTLWFDHYSTGNEYSTESGKQIDFKLNADGGTIYISSSTGSLLTAQTYPPMMSRASYARTTDGGDEWRFTSTPTPAATNAGSPFADRQLETPMVDHTGTVYKTPFQIQVNIPQGATLKYTTDGTTPTLTNGETSTDGVFNIDGGNYVFRFRFFKDGWLASPVATHTYIYNDKDYYLPIVSVVTDSRNLYDPQIGAYVDGTNGINNNGGNGYKNSNKNRSWERPVNFEYIIPDNAAEYSVALNQEADFEVSGGWSRHFKPNASFKLKTAKVYEGMNYFDFPIFSSKPYIKNKAVIVRNGGNDCNCRIIDAAIHEILRSSGFYIDCQAWQPAHIFINGQYQFMFNLRETNNKNFGYSNYGIDKDEMDQFEFGSSGFRMMVGDNVAYQQLKNLAGQLASQPNNENLWNQICDLLDVDEFCNYMAAGCYVGCNDWVTNNNNIKGFRARPDGRYHLVFMDMDQGFAVDNMLNSMRNNGWGWNVNDMITLFVNLLNNADFKRRFIDTYCIVAGSIFEPERSTEIITRMADYMAPALALDGKDPWRIVGSSGSNTSSSGTTLLNAITNQSQRNTRINTLRSYFSLNKSYDVTISSNLPEAFIMINGVKIPTGKFTGTLFGPVTLTTAAPAGYKFKGWQSTGGVTNLKTLVSTSATWNYYDKGSLDGKNWTAPDYVATGWSNGTAPLGYGNITGASGSNDIKTTLNYGTDSNNKRPTNYFRRTFNLDNDPTDKDIIELEYYVDDGCIIYVNGTELTRYLMPEGNITYNQYSTTYVGNVAYNDKITIPNSMLHAGVNTIAVEIHNNSGTSSDSYWTASITKGEIGSPEASEEFNFDALAANNHYDIMACYEPIEDDSIQFDGQSLIITTDDAPFAPIRINEVSAANTIYVNEYFKKNDWIELFNATEMPINVAGLYITDNPNKLQKYQIPADVPGLNTIIPAGGYLVIWADNLYPLESSLAATTSYTNLTDIHTLFKLGNTDGQTVILTSSEEFVANNQQYFEAHPTFAAGFTDQIIYDTHEGIQSVGRYPDGGNEIYVMNRPTIGNSNMLHSLDKFLRIDEGMRGSNNPELAIEGIRGNDTGTASQDVAAVYTTSGLFVAKKADNLEPGLYIVKYADGHSRKVMIANNR